MKPVTRRALVAAPALLAGPAFAEDARWPERPLKLIVPFPPGTTPDVAGRAVASHFSQALGQPCIVENRGGAGGNIGTDAVARAADGHTIGVSINGPLSTARALYPNLPYDPQRDLAPVSLLMRGTQLLVVHPGTPGGDLAGFLAHARANPGKLTFGSVGAGSGGHLAVVEIMSRAGLDMVHVPYRGFPQAVIDLVAGRIDAMVLIGAGILPQVREGSVRALAVTGEARLAELPQVPTLVEAGLAEAPGYAWIGLIAPAATPAERVRRLAAEAARGLAVPATRGALEAAGFEVVASGPEDLARLIAAETARWGGLITRLGIRADS